MGEDALRSDRLFDSQVDLHDRQHFEIAFNFDMSPEAAHDDGRANFRVDAFFFLPTNLGVSALSYGKDDFFKDVLSYLRFKTPSLQTSELADPLNSHSPLNVLTFNLKQLVDRPERDPALEQSTIHEAKLLGCILIANWRDLRKQARELGVSLPERTRAAHAEGLLRGLGDRLEAEHELLLRFRGLRRAYCENRACLDRQVTETLRLVDEYLTYRFDENLAKIHEACAGSPETASIEERLRWLGRLEATYRRDEGFIELSSQDSERLELYTYRTGALKKLLAQVLYLNVHTVRETHRFRSLVAAFGAGLAAFWSVYGNNGVQFQFHGRSTGLVLLGIILVYILKDRLKDFFKEYLVHQVQRLLPDMRMTIIDPISRQRIGSCRQTVRYEQKAKIPEDIRHVREFAHSLDLDEAREEEVLSFRHAMILEARTINATHARQMHVKHILRYSVANLQRRLSDPHTRVPHFSDDSGRFEVVLAPKVYHVNVVFRVTPLRSDGHGLEPVYHRLRVVLNKDGIERIEAVALNKHLWEIDHMVEGRLRESSEALHVTEAGDFSPS